MQRTLRLTFAKIQLGDLELYHQLTGSAAVMKQVTGVAYSLEETRAELERIIGKFGKNPNVGLWIAKDAGNEFIGVGALIPVDETVVDLGYRIKEEAWNKGYGLEIGKALLEFAIAQQNITKIVAVTEVENLGSKRILEKIGMLPIKKANTHDSLLEYAFLKK